MGLFSILLLPAALQPASGLQEDASFHLEQLGKLQAVEEEGTFSREGVQPCKLSWIQPRMSRSTSDGVERGCQPLVSWPHRSIRT